MLMQRHLLKLFAVAILDLRFIDASLQICCLGLHKFLILL